MEIDAVKQEVIVGIDSGLTGAISVVTNDDEMRLLSLVDMPVIEKQYGTGMEVNGYIFDDFITEIIEIYDIKMINLEQIGFIPNKGGGTAFLSLGRSFGVVEGVLMAHQLTIDYINPTVWKRQMGLIKSNKKDSINLAKKMYPDFEHLFKRVSKDDGRAESLLIANFKR